MRLSSRSFQTLAAALAAALVVGPHSAGAQAAPQERVSLDRIVAVVGASPITMYELQGRINTMRQEGVQVPTDSAGRLAFARDVLDQMIDDEVLLQKAADLKIELADADVTLAVDRQVKQVRDQFPSDQEFRGALQGAGLGTPEEYRRYIAEQLRRTQLQQRLIDSLRQDGRIVPTNVSEREIGEAFERQRVRLPQRPPSITFRQIVIPTAASEDAKARARAKADSLLAEIRSGVAFEQVARREGMDGTREVGGDLGWARPGQMVPEFERWIFSLRPGELGPVIETPFGFHVIRVDRRQPGEVRSRHILIRADVQPADIERTRLLADSVATRWGAGTPFDSLARRYHDYASKEETSVLAPFPVDSLPESYRNAVANKAVGDIVTFEIPGVSDVPKFVALQIASFAEGGPPRLADWRERIRQSLAQEGGFRRFIDSLRDATYVSVRLSEISLAAF
ncbi:MAG: peptidylprolyl isomerase [Gemmatimonadaceae bacterium]|nr:peptidylprolyl isomerase [Gemmatimonadaceae bacterium]